MSRRIVAVAGATTVLVLIAFLVPLLILVRQIALTRATAAANASAQTVVTVLLTVASVDEARLGVDTVNTSGPLRTTVFYPDGTQLGAPAAVNADVLLARSQRQSFDTSATEGRAVYLAVDLGHGPCCVVVRTFVPQAQVDAGVLPASMILIGLAVVLLLAALLVARVLARSLVRPLLAVADVAHGLHDGDLSRRAEPTGPAEIAAIGTTLNGLAARIDLLLRTERETVADLSHRVRTPLTALRLNVEALNDPEEAERLAVDVDAVERSVSHVIEQARLPSRRASTGDLAGAVRRRLEFWSVLAKEQGRDVEVSVPGVEVPVRVAQDRIEATLDALVGNVFAHTPAATPFAVRVDAGRPPGVPPRLTVQDAGPGLAGPGLVERGRSGAGSTGLGLDIARRTGEACGGSLTVSAVADRPPHGLRAVVTFGPAAPPAG